MSGLIRRFVALFLDSETGSGWRLPALDGVRGFAALAVTLAHAYEYLRDADLPFVHPLIRWGGQGGVMLFFALSGFLLYLPFVRSMHEGTSAPSTRNYVLRRCLRIMPAYYACVLILAAVSYVDPSAETATGLQVVMHLLFLPNLTSRAPGFLSVFWTLQVEEFYYWLLPLFHRWVFVRSPAAGLGASFACAACYAALVLSVVHEGALHTALSQTPFYLPSFACGMFAAHRWAARRSSRNALALVVFGLASYAAVAYGVPEPSDVETPFLNLAMAPGCAAIVLGVAQGALPALASTPMRWIGSISYSLYLWHFVVIRRIPMPDAFDGGLATRLCWALPVSVGVAVASYLLVERPFLRLRPSTAPRSTTLASTRERVAS